MLRHLRSYRSPLLLTPADDNKGGGGGGKNLTIEEQLSSARNDLQVALDKAARFEQQLKDEQADKGKLQSQFDAATKEATDAKTKLADVEGKLSDANVKIADLEAKNKNFASSVTRLEKLCDVKGVDRNAAVPPLDEKSGNDAHVFDQWVKADRAERVKLMDKHGPEIRAEAKRREKAGQN